MNRSTHELEFTAPPRGYSGASTGFIVEVIDCAWEICSGWIDGAHVIRSKVGAWHINVQMRTGEERKERCRSKDCGECEMHVGYLKYYVCERRN